MTRAAAWLIAALATALVVLAGCAGDPPLPGTAAPAVSASPVVPRAETEYGLTVPRLNLRTPLTEVGRNPDGTIEVPPLERLDEVGVYRDGPMPGERGPAVVLAHINGRGADGVSRDGPFAELASMRAGDVITAATPRGDVTYWVYEVARVPKEQFPTKAVYSNVPTPELRLLSCGGALDASGHNYDSNIIVFARMVS